MRRSAGRPSQGSSIRSTSYERSSNSSESAIASASSASIATSHRSQSRRLRNRRASTALPAAMPERNAASITVNAYVVTCRKSTSTRNHTTSSASEAKPDTAKTASRRRRTGVAGSSPTSATGARSGKAPCSRIIDSAIAIRPTATLIAAATRNDAPMPMPPISQNPASSVPAIPPAVLAA